jgi:hypothetical protein
MSYRHREFTQNRVFSLENFKQWNDIAEKPGRLLYVISYFGGVWF